MRKLSVGRALDRFCLVPAAAAYTSSCLCNNGFLSGHGEEEEANPLIPSPVKHRTPSSMKLKDAIAGPPTLAFQLKPKKVVLRVSMHCGGCARKVEKHISKLEELQA
ncbi:uncharacterized protein LOC127251972 isoform X2 [Andrographis paniculata]|uniref:uncharacterized protein LOC127251972 isoform X2 n=1 Tax=Andrographis paniculata TaxID=175694 RepID=UPI0021E72B3B|nr:uncharacterized protein LOC127251972 isoform X2 [Andrographis paniculata]